MYSSDPIIARVQAKRDVFRADYDLTKNTAHDYNRLIARQINLLARATDPGGEYKCFERIAAFAALGMALTYPRKDGHEEGAQAGE